MAIQSNRTNAIPEFVELRAMLTQDDESGKPKYLKVDLRIQPSDLEDEDGNVLAVISILRAVLCLNLDGLDVAPGTRLGEPVKGPGATIKTARRETTTTSAKAVGGASLGASTTGQPEASLKAGFDGSRERITSETLEVDEQQQHIYVKARGNDTWEVTEPNGKTLDGTYLNNTALCEFLLRAGANRAGVQSSVEIKQKDLNLDFKKGALSILNNNKKKLIGILIAKSLTNEGSEYKGKIVLSNTEAEYE